MTECTVPRGAGALRPYRERVAAAYLDYNGHMNEAYYVLVFSHANDDLMDQIGLDHKSPERRTRNSFFTLESHIGYIEDCGEGTELEIHIQLLDRDAKRLHYFQTMREFGSGRLIATAEMLCMHVAMPEPKAMPFPDDMAAKIETIWAHDQTRPAPERAGRRIGIRRKG